VSASAGLAYEVLPGAQTLEEKVAYLMKRAEDTNARLTKIEAFAQRAPKDWAQADEAMAARLTADMSDEIDEVREAYIRPRLTGIILLLVGSVLLAVANFLN
jgi:hypothetical protein